jgi:hypothetical protein
MLFSISLLFVTKRSGALAVKPHCKLGFWVKDGVMRDKQAGKSQ